MKSSGSCLDILSWRINSPLKYGDGAHIELLFLRDRMFPFESLGTEDQAKPSTLGSWSIRTERTPLDFLTVTPCNPCSIY